VTSGFSSDVSVISTATNTVVALVSAGNIDLAGIDFTPNELLPM
jgi:hypothetical protein